MCCSAGSQPEAFAAVIASHLSLCKSCCCEVRRMQQIGVALFDKLEPARMAAPAPIVAMRAGEAHSGTRSADIKAERAPQPCGANAGEVPPPLVPLVGSSLDDVAWRWTAPGVWSFPIRLSKGCCGDLQLIKVAPGKALPEHGHQGQELTLILRGSYTDALGTYRRGDVEDLDEGVAHGPVACPEKGCICLMATEGKAARFKGMLARLLKPFFRI
jgi:putative transcriptional regulator